MTIPAGATHVDENGDYYHQEPDGRYTRYYYFSGSPEAVGWFHSDYASHLGIIPISQKMMECV